MIAIPLQSGSNGNCTYVESGETCVLIDAGISATQAAERLAACGRDIRQVRAVIISHDHTDHVRCAGVLHRKLGAPVHATEATLAAARRRCDLGRLADVRLFRRGQTIQIDGLSIETFPTLHDASDGSAFVVEAEGRRLGILTDLGCVFDRLRDVVASLDAVLLESNYDPGMLERGPYPAHVKERIRGPGGHLSNEEAAWLLRECAPAGLRWACLSHLSEQNNSPAVALRTHRRILPGPMQLVAASRYGAVMLPEL